MKKASYALIALLILSGTALTAGAATTGSGVSLDATLNYADEPAGGFDAGWGLELGANIDLRKMGMQLSTSQGVDLLGRVSIGYYDWDDDFPLIDLSYRRIPLFVGARAVMSAAPQVKLYGQLGLEMSFDKAEFNVPGLGVVSDDDVNLGLTPGVGALFPLGDQFYLGVGFNYHIIDDSYWTFGLTAGINLP